MPFLDCEVDEWDNRNVYDEYQNMGNTHPTLPVLSLNRLSYMHPAFSDILALSGETCFSLTATNNYSLNFVADISRIMPANSHSTYSTLNSMGTVHFSE
jgi:hypothetical protein